MPNSETFNDPDADIILRAPGPPKCDFRVHKLVLSLASPVFKDMFSLPQPTSDDSRRSRKSGVGEMEIIEVTDPADALDIVLRMIYPFPPPSLDGSFDTLVDCLDITEKYDIKGAKSQLYSTLARTSATQPLRAYATAARFGFANLKDSISRHILSSVHLTGISELPDDFDFVSATEYHKLIRQRANYLGAVVEIVKQTPLKSWCYSCPGERRFMEEMFRLRLAHLIIAGTPVEPEACSAAWVKAYEDNAECKEGCVLKFICSAISRVNKGLVKPGTSPPQQKVALKKA